MGEPSNILGMSTPFGQNASVCAFLQSLFKKLPNYYLGKPALLAREDAHEAED